MVHSALCIRFQHMKHIPPGDSSPILPIDLSSWTRRAAARTANLAFFCDDDAGVFPSRALNGRDGVDGVI
jgi:hypothetical protein